MKRPIKVYLSAHSEDLASASRVAGLMLGELGCEVVADYTPVEKAKQCRANRRRSLQRCNVFLQLVGRDAGPILAPEHQHDSLCSVAVWEAGEALALQKPVVRMLLADDFPFDESGRIEDDEEITRFQTMHRHRLMSHQRSALPVEDYEDLVQRLGRMWGGTFARQHKLPELGLGPETLDEICGRVSDRLFDQGSSAPNSPATPPEHAGNLPPEDSEEVSPPRSGASVLPLSQAPIVVPSTPLTQIVPRSAGTIVPRGQGREGDAMVSKKPDPGTIGANAETAAHTVEAVPLRRPENTEQCSQGDPSRQASGTNDLEADSLRGQPRSSKGESQPNSLAEAALATEDSAVSSWLPPAATAVSSELPSDAKNPVGQTTPSRFPLTGPLRACPPAVAPPAAGNVTLANGTNASEGPVATDAAKQLPPISPALPASPSGNLTARVPIFGLSAPATVIAASRHALFLSLLEQSGAGLKQAALLEAAPPQESDIRPVCGSGPVLQAPMKLEFSRPMLHAPPPVAGSAPQQWRMPFRRRPPSTSGEAAPGGVQTAPACLTATAASIVGTLKFPGDIPKDSPSDEVKGFRPADVSVERSSSLYTKRMRMTLALVGGMLLWALGLLLHAGWQHFVSPRPALAVKSEGATSPAQKPSKISLSVDGPSREMAASPQSTPVPSSAPERKPTAIGESPTSKVSTASTSASVPAEINASTALTLEEEQDILECHLEAAIVRMRQSSGDEEYTQAQEILRREILPKFQELAPKVATRESHRSPRALAMSRHLASIHLLCNHPQAARNTLLDMQEYLSETRPPSDAEVRLADYLVKLTDNYAPSSLQDGATPKFPMTPGEMQHLLNILHSRPDWMPGAGGAAIVGTNASAK